jgi:hypothetical protein
MAKKRITSRPGLFGTVYYYDENGRPVGKSRPGLLDGTRVYTDQNGRYAGKSRPGFLAKEVFTDTDHNHITSYDSLLGEVHFKNGTPVGHTRPGFFDSAYTTLDEEEEIVEDEYYEEDLYTEDEELLDAYEDEDVEEAEYEEYSPEVSQYTVVRNLQLFVLCLVICMVIAVIYAIVKFN